MTDRQLSKVLEFIGDVLFWLVLLAVATYTVWGK